MPTFRVIGPDGKLLWEGDPGTATLNDLQDRMGKEAGLTRWYQFSRDPEVPLLDKTRTMREQGVQAVVPGLLPPTALASEQGGVVYAYLCDEGSLSERRDCAQIIDHAGKLGHRASRPFIRYSDPIEELRGERVRALDYMKSRGHTITIDSDGRMHSDAAPPPWWHE